MADSKANTVAGHLMLDQFDQALKLIEAGDGHADDADADATNTTTPFEVVLPSVDYEWVTESDLEHRRTHATLTLSGTEPGGITYHVNSRSVAELSMDLSSLVMFDPDAYNEQMVSAMGHAAYGMSGAQLTSFKNAVEAFRANHGMSAVMHTNLPVNRAHPGYNMVGSLRPLMLPGQVQSEPETYAHVELVSRPSLESSCDVLPARGQATGRALVLRETNDATVGEAAASSTVGGAAPATTTTETTTVTTTATTTETTTATTTVGQLITDEAARTSLPPTPTAPREHQALANEATTTTTTAAAGPTEQIDSPPLEDNHANASRKRRHGGAESETEDASTKKMKDADPAEIFTETHKTAAEGIRDGLNDQWKDVEFKVGSTSVRGDTKKKVSKKKN